MTATKAAVASDQLTERSSLLLPAASAQGAATTKPRTCSSVKTQPNAA